jgi:hypothetical protein
MELLHFVSGHGFEVVGTVAIIASLLFTAVELRHVERAQKIQNLLTITRHHRDIWIQFLDRPELARVLDPKADLAKAAVSRAEMLFIGFLLNHLNASLKAARAKMLVPVGELEKDIRRFFALPVPRRVWELKRPLLDAELVGFVEACLNDLRP